MKRKPKPATAGEKMVLARVRETLGPKTMTLSEFRTRYALCHCRAEAKAHDRAIARAVRKERERCIRWAVLASDCAPFVDACRAKLNKIINGDET